MRETSTYGSQGKRAQSEIFGIVLLLAMSLLTISMIFVFGQPSVTQANELLSSERSDNEFSLLDARIATTALGASQIQGFTMNVNEGELISDPDAAMINITQEYTSTNNTNRTLFVGEMGHVRHEKPGGKIVAYEGGGVWRRERGGEQATMVSSPEFHYEGQTLTLPMFNITSDSTRVGESSRIQVNASQDPTTRYPISVEQQKEYNTTGAPDAAGGLFTNGEVGDPDDSGVESRDNPLSNGSIFITVKSDFYKGWQEYFEQRSEGQVTNVDESENEVRMELTVPADPTEIDSGGIFEDSCNVNGAATCNDTFNDDYETGVNVPDADEYVDTVMDEARSSGTTWTNSCGDCDDDLYYANATDGTLTIDSGSDFDVEDNTVTVALDGDATINEVDIDDYNESNPFRLEIVTNGNIEFVNGARNNDSQNSTKMVIFNSGSNTIQFNGNQGDDTYGVLYAPDSEIRYNGAPNWKWEGSLIGQSFRNNGNPGTVAFGEEMEINPQLIEDPITFLHITENRIRVR